MEESYTLTLLPHHSYTFYSYTPYSYMLYSYTPYSYTPYSYTLYSYTPTRVEAWKRGGMEECRRGRV